MRWVLNATPRPFYRRERDPVTTVQEIGCALRASLDGRGKCHIHRGWNPGPQLYQLSYPYSTNIINDTITIDVANLASRLFVC
jgi:hypothetical protein